MLGVTLLRPWALVLLPLLAWFAWRIWQRPPGLGDWANEVDPQLMAAMQAMGMTGTRVSHLRSGLTIAALAALVIALAGPATLKREATSYRNVDGVIFILDASAETVESADWPDMVTLLRSSLPAMGSRPASLIVFGEDAYVALDSTYDLGELGLTVSHITDETVPVSRAKPPPDPAKGLRMAARLVDQAQLLASDTVLITRVEVGAAALAAVPELRNTRLIVAMPDPVDAQPLARAAEGEALALTDTARLAELLSTPLHQRLEAQDVPLNFHADQGRWFVGFALIPLALLLMGRRREVRE